MSISAAPMIDGGALAKGFGALGFSGEVKAQSIIPMKAFESKTAAPVTQLQTQVRSAAGNLDRAIGGAFDARKQAERTFGMAGAEQGKVANIFNPAKDGMMAATALAIPVLAPAVSALALASALSYMQADRKGAVNKKQLQARFEDQFRSINSSYTKRDVFDTDWKKTSYSKPVPTNDHDQLQAAFEALNRPLEQDYDFKILLGQRAHVQHVEAANENRSLKGVPVSRQSAEKAEERDSKRLNDMNRLMLNLPGNTF